MVQIACQRLYSKASRSGRCLAGTPTHDLGDVDGRNQILLWRWQDGIGPDLRIAIELCAAIVAAGKRDHRCHRDTREKVPGARRYDDHDFTPTRCL